MKNDLVGAIGGALGTLLSAWTFLTVPPDNPIRSVLFALLTICFAALSMLLFRRWQNTKGAAHDEEQE